MSALVTREVLLDWFDDFEPSHYYGEQLLGAYNALTGSTATLVCTHCGEPYCPGTVETKRCPWFGIGDCRRCNSRARGYCSCDIAATE